MPAPTVLSPLASPTFAVERALTRRLLSLVRAEGLGPLLAAHAPFSSAEAIEILRTHLGFALDDRVRVRMVRVLIDFLAECGHIRESPDGTLAWEPRAQTSDESPSGGAIAGPADGHLAFFDRCLAHAPAFLRGGPPLFDFGEDSTLAWENLLGSGDFPIARSYLARLVLPRDARPCRALVLCYGPGFDLLEIERRRPETSVTALDFTDSFQHRASARLQHADRVCWTPAASWGGFGADLPFDDGSFDLVVFSCADPYIPDALREGVYREIHRVIGAGGALGLLTRSYPDRDRREVKDAWVRRATCCHDFLEGVCRGWQGFRDAASSRRLFQAVGFTVDIVTLNGSLWRLAKGPSPAVAPVERRER